MYWQRINANRFMQATTLHAVTLCACPYSDPPLPARLLIGAALAAPLAAALTFSPQCAFTRP